MKRTTIMLPGELHERAVRYAVRHRKSMGKVIREALQVVLSETEPRAARDPLFADEVVFQGKGPLDLSARHDHYLYDDDL